MQTQNVTLAIPKDILHKAKLIAIQRHTSLSQLLATTLREVVEQDEAYNQAKADALSFLNHGWDLGTNGQIKTKREELHER